METTIEQLLKNSESFVKRLRFSPPTANSIKELLKENPENESRILEMARTTRPILLRNLICPINKFIALKLKCGTPLEQELYGNMFHLNNTLEMNARIFVSRLMCKRPVVFYMPSDDYTLANGTHGHGGFEDIPTGSNSRLSLNDYMSYDEMQFSACVSMSVPTFFINTGSRGNYAQKSRVPFQKEGIYTGCVGARLERTGVMEWQHTVINPEQNTKENGYGLHADATLMETARLRLWAEFYDLPGGVFPTFEEVKMLVNQGKNDHYCKVEHMENIYLNKLVFSKRMQLTIEAYLFDANERAAAANKKAHCFVVGLGLGVWRLSNAQTQLLVDVYATVLSQHNLSDIAEITFSWFDANTCGGIANGGYFTENNNNVRFNFTRTDPAVPLQDPNQLLVAQYAWDGNSYPGNEYWRSQFAASGDPAAACCSLISELQNPSVNVEAFAPDRVCFFGPPAAHDECCFGDYLRGKTACQSNEEEANCVNPHSSLREVDPENVPKVSSEEVNTDDLSNQISDDAHPGEIDRSSQPNLDAIQSSITVDQVHTEELPVMKIEDNDNKF